MKVGVVVHGPEVIYSGFASRVLDVLERCAEVEARLGGTMGKCALFDVGEHRIKMFSETPSESVNALSACDVVVLANQAKSIESALAFGHMVAHNSTCGALCQVEPGMCIPWRGRGEGKRIASMLSLSLVERFPTISSVKRRGSTVMRRVNGVRVGESIRVNGIVVGRATSSNVVLVEKDGEIVDIVGGVLKRHGVEKLGRVSLESAIVRTGVLRRCVARRRVVPPRGSTIYLIDHDAEHCFELAPRAAGAITVGDDTTTICADILSRFSVPVLGIVDGDLDGSLVDCTICPGSLILRVKKGCDDVVGRLVRRRLFKGGTSISGKCFDEVKAEVLDIADRWVVDIAQVPINVSGESDKPF